MRSFWGSPLFATVILEHLSLETVDGAGLSLLLTETWTGDVVGSQTIWEADYSPPPTSSGSPDSGSYYDLAEWAAVWTWYEVIRRYG